MEAKESFKVNIKSLDDRKMEYTLARGTTIAEFKRKISESTSLPVDQIRLIYQARNLQDSQHIEEIVQGDDEIIHLIAKLNPAQPPREQPRPQQPAPMNLNSFLGDISSLLGGLGPQQQVPNRNFVSMTIPMNPNPQGQPNAQPNVQPEGMPDLNSIFAQTMQQVNAMLGGQQGTFQNPQGGPQQQNLQNTQPVNPRDMDVEEGQPQTTQPNQPQVQPPQQNLIQGQNGMNVEQQAPNQPAGPQTQTFMPNNLRVNNIVSVNSQGINISIAQPNQEPHNFVLNTEKLRNLKDLNDRMRNSNIDVPRRQETNNSATILSGYLHTLRVSLYNFLPTLDQATEILEAEQRLNDPAQRAQATEYIQGIGQTLKSYKEIFDNLEFMSKFTFNDRPGRFSIGALEENARRTDPNDESRIQRDRDNIRNMMDMLQGGISANQSIGELSRMAVVNDIDEDDNGSDCVNILFEPLNISELMGLMSGNMGVIDANHPKIKKNFQNTLIKHDNSKEAVKKVLLDNMTDEILLMIKNKGEGHSNPNFDYDYIIKEINSKYIDEFGTLLLKDYEEQAALEEMFSMRYIKLLKRYLGHIAFELSQSMPNGLDDFRFILREGFIEYINKRMEMPGFDLVSLFDNLIWKHVYEGYLEYQRDHREVSEKKLLLSRLNDFKEIDEAVEPETHHSEVYLKGKILE